MEMARHESSSKARLHRKIQNYKEGEEAHRGELIREEEEKMKMFKFRIRFHD
jgi:hypothetical protein